MLILILKICCLEYEYVKIYNIQDKCIVTTDYTICNRLAHDGYFLLDTVFQTSFKAGQTTSPNIKTLEINAFEAKGLLNAFKQIEPDNVNGLDEIINQLKLQLSSEMTGTADQWSTVQITDTFSKLLTILTQSLHITKFSIRFHFWAKTIFFTLIVLIYVNFRLQFFG